MRCASLTPGAPGVQAQSPGRRDAAASEAASAAEAAAIRAEAVEEGALEMGALEAYILAQRPPAAQARALAVRPPPPPPPLPPRRRPRPRPRAPVRLAAPRPALALLPVAPGGRLGACRGPHCPCGARAAGRPPVLLQTVCGCGRLSVRQRTGGDPAPEEILLACLVHVGLAFPELPQPRRAAPASADLARLVDAFRAGEPLPPPGGAAAGGPTADGPPGAGPSAAAPPQRTPLPTPPPSQGQAVRAAAGAQRRALWCCL